MTSLPPGEPRCRRPRSPPACLPSGAGRWTASPAPGSAPDAVTRARIPLKLAGGPEWARPVLLARSGPPAGRVRWAMRLLADKLVELAVVALIDPATVCRTIQKTRSSRRSGGSGSSRPRRSARSSPRWGMWLGVPPPPGPRAPGGVRGRGRRAVDRRRAATPAGAGRVAGSGGLGVRAGRHRQPARTARRAAGGRGHWAAHGGGLRPVRRAPAGRGVPARRAGGAGHRRPQHPRRRLPVRGVPARGGEAPRRAQTAPRTRHRLGATPY